MIRSVLLLCSFLLCGFPSTALATEFQIVTHENEGAVLLVATTSINAIEGEIGIPEGVIVESTNDARSVISFWIVRPELSPDGRRIPFAGIIPGGFSGEGILFHLKGEGIDRLVIDKERTRSLLNDGSGTTDKIIVLPTGDLPPHYRFSETRDETTPIINISEIDVLPTEEGEKEMLIFHGSDGESGIMRYEIAWSDTPVAPDDTSLVWTRVESPVVLPKNAEGKYAYVKAINGIGQSHVQVVQLGGARDMPTRLAILAIILGILVGGVAVRFILAGTHPKNTNIRHPAQ